MKAIVIIVCMMVAAVVSAQPGTTILSGSQIQTVDASQACGVCTTTPSACPSTCPQAACAVCSTTPSMCPSTCTVSTLAVTPQPLVTAVVTSPAPCLRFQEVSDCPCQAAGPTCACYQPACASSAGTTILTGAQVQTVDASQACAVCASSPSTCPSTCAQATRPMVPATVECSTCGSSCPASCGTVTAVVTQPAVVVATSVPCLRFEEVSECPCQASGPSCACYQTPCAAAPAPVMVPATVECNACGSSCPASCGTVTAVVTQPVVVVAAPAPCGCLAEPVCACRAPSLVESTAEVAADTGLLADGTCGCVSLAVCPCRVVQYVTPELKPDPCGCSACPCPMVSCGCNTCPCASNTVTTVFTTTTATPCGCQAQGPSCPCYVTPEIVDPCPCASLPVTVFCGCRA